MRQSTQITGARIPRAGRVRRCGTAAGGLVLAAAALSACGGTVAPPVAAVPSSAAPTAAVAAVTAQRVVLSEWKVDVPTTLHAGKVTLDIANIGAIQHELLVFKSDLPLAQYPLQTSGAINEDGAGITKVSDGDNLDLGTSQARTVDLTLPGTYLFVCNLPAHFHQGMYTVVTVTP